MKLEIPREELDRLVAKQIDSLFLFDPAREQDILSAGIGTALKKCETCFEATPNKYYKRDGKACFNPFHSGQCCIFLYFLSRAVFLMDLDQRSLADRVYYLNKALNGLDLFYEVDMPDVFFLDHPVGSVLGRATYGSHFSFSQNCTVGNNKGIFPSIGKNVQMMSGSKILGNCHIGDNVIVSANTYIKDTDIPENSLVFGSSPNLIIKQRTKN
jgi:serine O-acetyltransferase